MASVGDKLDALHGALVDAFTPEDLERLASFRLSVRLDEIAKPGNLSDTVFALLDWAIRYGRLKDLLDGALLENPDNPSLKQFRQSHPDFPSDADLAELRRTRKEPADDAAAGTGRRRRRMLLVLSCVVGVLALVAVGTVLAVYQFSRPDDPGTEPALLITSCEGFRSDTGRVKLVVKFNPTQHAADQKLVIEVASDAAFTKPWLNATTPVNAARGQVTIGLAPRPENDGFVRLAVVDPRGNHVGKPGKAYAFTIQSDK